MSDYLEHDKKAAKSTEPQTEQRPELAAEYDDRVLEDSATRVSRFEDEQSNTLANIAADATGGDVGLSNEELKQIKEQSGINTKLDSLAQKARELLDALKEKALDYKINRTIKAASYNQGKGINFDYAKLAELIVYLNTQQIKKNT